MKKEKRGGKKKILSQSRIVLNSEPPVSQNKWCLQTKLTSIQKYNGIWAKAKISNTLFHIDGNGGT